MFIDLLYLFWGNTIATTTVEMVVWGTIIVRRRKYLVVIIVGGWTGSLRHNYRGKKKMTCCFRHRYLWYDLVDSISGHNYRGKRKKMTCRCRYCCLWYDLFDGSPRHNYRGKEENDSSLSSSMSLVWYCWWYSEAHLSWEEENDLSLSSSLSLVWSCRSTAAPNSSWVHLKETFLIPLRLNWWSKARTDFDSKWGT